MAENKIIISPLTRIEGHLSIHTDTEPVNGADGTKTRRVTSARCEGEMFRGFENILVGRDPLDAQQFVQRICGVCPITHGIASCRAQEMAYGIQPMGNGRLLQNLIEAGEYSHSHLLHFYHLSALDFVDVTAVLQYSGKDRGMLALKSWVQSSVTRSQQGKEVFPAAPFLPRYEGDYYIKDAGINCDLVAHYVEALTIRRIAHEMAAVFGARLPHSTALVPGGCTQVPTEERVVTYRSRLKKIADFVENVYFTDVLAAAQAFPQYWEIGSGYRNLMSYGVFEEDDFGKRLFAPGVMIDGKWESLDAGVIAEEVSYSRFSSASGRHPSAGETIAAPDKKGAYSWLKAPRYKGRPMEVGPLARVLVDYNSPGGGVVKADVDAILKTTGLSADKLYSVLGRILCRAIELRIIVRKMFQWLDELQIDAAPAQTFDLVKEGSGYGLTEAARGALGHWISVKDYRIANYQCVVPTTWNCSPRDDSGKPGPMEKSLEGVVVADPDQPMEVARVVRSFDPCLACAIH
jgi:Ni,Fe-hydrogenase I large subunit